jgi:hypothetical protein
MTSCIPLERREEIDSWRSRPMQAESPAIPLQCAPTAERLAGAQQLLEEALQAAPEDEEERQWIADAVAEAWEVLETALAQLDYLPASQAWRLLLAPFAAAAAEEQQQF